MPLKSFPLNYFCLTSRLPHAPGDHPELLPLALRVFAQGGTQQASGPGARYEDRMLPDCLPVYRAQTKTCAVTTAVSDLTTFTGKKKTRKEQVTQAGLN